MNNFNNNLCHSIKSKSDVSTQCCNKPKINETLCGIHIKSKNVILYKSSNNNSNDSVISLNLVDIKPLNIDMCIDSNIDQKIYEPTELFDKILNNINLNVYNIRTSIKKSYLNKLIDTKQSKQSLIQSLKKIIFRERFYLNNQYYIILIQSVFRRWIVQRRKLCCNDTDILTFTCKYEIPEIYFYIFKDKFTKKKYAYDIRTLNEIINSDYPSCPYTFRNFTEEEKKEITLYKNQLIQCGINVDIEKKKLTIEEETDMLIKDVFYQINMLDNYTNHIWFKDLNINQLIHFYALMEDIWNYRSSMTLQSKKKIIKNGIIFNIPVHIIKHEKSLIRMQNLLLSEFMRLINEGVDREEKKLGAILILTGLVEISHEAADALPHLIQI